MQNLDRGLIITELSRLIAPLMVEALTLTLPHQQVIVTHPLHQALLGLRLGEARTTAEQVLMEESHVLGAKAAEMGKAWGSFNPRRTIPFTDPLANFVNTVGRWLPDSTMLGDLSELDREGTPASWPLLHRLLDGPLSNSITHTITWVQKNGLKDDNLTVFRTLDPADFFDNAGFERPLKIYDLARYHFLQLCFYNQNPFDL